MWAWKRNSDCKLKDINKPGWYSRRRCRNHAWGLPRALKFRTDPWNLVLFMKKIVFTYLDAKADCCSLKSLHPLRAVYKIMIFSLNIIITNRQIVESFLNCDQVFWLFSPESQKIFVSNRHILKKLLNKTRKPYYHEIRIDLIKIFKITKIK